MRPSRREELHPLHRRRPPRHGGPSGVRSTRRPESPRSYGDPCTTSSTSPIRSRHGAPINPLSTSVTSATKISLVAQQTHRRQRPMANHLTPTELAREAGLERRGHLEVHGIWGCRSSRDASAQDVVHHELCRPRASRSRRSCSRFAPRGHRNSCVAEPPVPVPGMRCVLRAIPVRRLVLSCCRVLAAALLTEDPATAASLSAVQAELGPAEGKLRPVCRQNRPRPRQRQAPSSTCAPTTSVSPLLVEKLFVSSAALMR